MSIFLFEKLIIPRLIKKHPHFMDPEGSSPLSQQTATCSYPKPHLISWRTIFLPSFHPHLGVPRRLCFPTKSQYASLLSLIRTTRNISTVLHMWPQHKGNVNRWNRTNRISMLNDIRCSSVLVMVWSRIVLNFVWNVLIRGTEMKCLVEQITPNVRKIRKRNINCCFVERSYK